MNATISTTSRNKRMPWTIAGLEHWIELKPPQKRHEIKRSIRDRTDIYDRSAYLDELKLQWRHEELGEPLPAIGAITTVPETPAEREARITEMRRQAAIDCLPTTDRRKILQHKSPDVPGCRPKLRGSSKPPWPWPR